MKIKVAITITERDGYNTNDVATGTLEVETFAPDQFSAAAIRRALDEVIEDVSSRVADQLRAIEKHERVKAASAESEAAPF